MDIVIYFLGSNTSLQISYFVEIQLDTADKCMPLTYAELFVPVKLVSKATDDILPST